MSDPAKMLTWWNSAPQTAKQRVYAAAKSDSLVSGDLVKVIEAGMHDVGETNSWLVVASATAADHRSDLTAVNYRLSHEFAAFLLDQQRP
jgi:hypothetical protein